jgi:predicted dehydrogenase
MLHQRHLPSRRGFLKSASLLAIGAALPAWFGDERRNHAARAAAQPPASANDRPHVALVGCGGRGLALAKEAQAYVNVVAVCDVDARHLANAAYEFAGAAAYRDFRDAIAHRGLDAVLVATPDHWHTLVNLHAMRQGKDVYSEKPLTLTIDEGKRVVRTCRETGRILQTGSQQRSDPRFHLACELVRNGRLGKLKQVMTVLPTGPHLGPLQRAPVPQDLDWEMWQGQAPRRAYVPERCHYTFRHWYDYSGGTMTDWGAHHNDIALWAMGLDRSGPVSVEGTRLADPVPGGYTAVPDFRVAYTYGNGVEHTCFSRAGAAPTPGPGVTGAQVTNGVRFIGTDGWIFVNRLRLEASDPDLLRQPLSAGAERLYASTNHIGNFVECMRSRNAPICDAEIGHRSASLCHLGNIALRVGRKLTWDPRRETFPDDAEARSYLMREMREPWSYEAV